MTKKMRCVHYLQLLEAAEAGQRLEIASLIS